MNRLAIVIPAYKGQYFDKALESIAKQTCKEFKLYIGDDGSPDDLRESVLKHNGDLNIVYRRFPENIGRVRLVKHWERCIDLIADEEWIWFFSDDDVMDSDCVEKFYHSLEKYPGHDIFHFDKLYIDQDHRLMKVRYPRYPEVLSSEEFLEKRLFSTIHSTMVEYVFRKSLFLERGRFREFDLAWGSDDALCIDLARPNGIREIESGQVFWRASPYNITTDRNNTEILLRKFGAEIEFKNWIQKLVDSREINVDPEVSAHQIEAWFLQKIKDRIEFLPFLALQDLMQRVDLYPGRRLTKNVEAFKLYGYKVYRHISNEVKRLIFWNKIRALLNLSNVS